jgi:cobalt-precorrin 5A hydrolase
LTRCDPGGLRAWTDAHFSDCDALVFIGSAGIAVRAIAGLVHSKASDPAVVVIDEQGRYVVPILSGHIGQANQLALRLARAIGATPVITTATDARGLFAVDDWATRQGLRIANPERIKAVSAALLAGNDIRLATEFPIGGPPPDRVVHDGDHWDVIITCRTTSADDQALHLVPPAITAGIGCRKGISAQAVEAAFRSVLETAGYHPLSVAEVCSVDLKANEPGLAEFCARRGLPFRTFSAAELAQVEGEFSASSLVTAVAGVDNVCERAAVLGSGGYLVAGKTARQGVTVALALREPSLHFEDTSTEEESWAC